MAWILLIGFCVLYGIYFLSRWTSTYLSQKKIIRENGCEPAKQFGLVRKSWLPFGLGVIKELLQAAGNDRVLDHFNSRYVESGRRTLEATILGDRTVFTIEPKNIQTVLATNFKDYNLGDRRSAFEPLLGQHGIFVSDGEAWEKARALLRPNFVRNQVADIDVYEEHVAKLIKLIPRDGSTVDIQDLFFRMTLDSATNFLFGHSANSLESSSSASSSNFATNFGVSLHGLWMRLLSGPGIREIFWNPIFNKKARGFNEAVRSVREYVGQFVQRAIDYRISLEQNSSEKASGNDFVDGEKPTYVFLNELSKVTKDKEMLTDQLLNILLAGRDTTAGALSITFWVLARRPDVWKKLREQIMRLNGRKPSFEQLKDMKYLTGVINEVLRLYPVVPSNARLALRDTVLPLGGGPDGTSPVFVGKGTEIAFQVYAMHRLPETFGEDANEFRPERWETGLMPGWGYLPFNGGPRICIGQQFALAQIGYTIVRIMQQFKAIEARDERPWKERMIISLSSKNGTKVALTPVSES